MKQYTKPFFITVFFVAISIFMLLFRKYEHDSILTYPVVNPTEVAALTSGKQLITTPCNLLYYQEQPLPFIRDSNIFLIPTNTSEYFINTISCTENGDIYFVPKEPEQSENTIDTESSDFFVYIINDASYFETSVSFVPSAILFFQTNAFENENAYGYMNFYMPDDGEIGMYSFKSSEAKLSYETTYGLLPQADRNYTLTLTKMGEQNNLNLANLRKDDDWELDSLFNCPDQIFQFYEEWNNFCSNIGQEQFMVHYQTIDFYLDEQYMGSYLLRIPLDIKQLDHAEGAFITEETAFMNAPDNFEMNVLHNLLANTIIDPSIRLEYYFWMDTKNNNPTIHVIPRRFTKYTMD